MTRFRNRYAFFYPMRVVGTYFLVLLIVLHVRQFESFRAYHMGLIALFLMYPHVAFLFARRHAHNRAKVENIAFIVDAFILGLVVHLNSFSYLPSLILTTVALVNAIAVNGFRQMFISGFALLAGIISPMPFLGPNFDPQNSFGVNAASSVFLFVYFIIFAYSSHNRSGLLTESQEELREQKSTLEIEKMRSDRLLMNLVPAGLAGEFEHKGRIEPREFDPVTIVAISFRGFSRLVEERDSREVLELLTHCFQGFDAIVERHGLEKLKTMGDLYMGIAGLPDAGADDAAAAIRAALEIRDFLEDLEIQRKARGLWVLEPRIGVHSGRVVGALVETARLSYDVWGGMVPALVSLQRGARPGQVLISEATRRLAGDAFKVTAAHADSTEGFDEGAVYRVEGHAA